MFFTFYLYIYILIYIYTNIYIYIYNICIFIFCIYNICIYNICIYNIWIYNIWIYNICISYVIYCQSPSVVSQITQKKKRCSHSSLGDLTSMRHAIRQTHISGWFVLHDLHVKCWDKSMLLSHRFIF